jgi:hypothetical protein
MVTFRVAPGADAGSISVALDNSWGWQIATVQVPGGGDGTAWTTITAPVSHVSGVHAIWLLFSQQGNSGFNVDWFSFE